MWYVFDIGSRTNFGRCVASNSYVNMQPLQMKCLHEAVAEGENDDIICVLHVMPFIINSNKQFSFDLFQFLEVMLIWPVHTTSSIHPLCVHIIMRLRNIVQKSVAP